MEIPDKVLKIGGAVIIVLLVVLVIVGAVKKSSYESQLVDLQNTVARKDQTIESQKGVYEKLTIQSEDLKSLLDQKDDELKSLQKQLKKAGAELLSVNTLVFQLKKDLESSGHVTVVKDPKAPGIVKVVFDSADDFDPFHVMGTTLVDCNKEIQLQGSGQVRFSQVRPIKISVVVSQQKDGSWKTSTTSSEENFGVDISLAAVNPLILETKWYENIGVSLDMGVGTGPGFLTGVGVSYKFGKFEAGPRAWVTLDRSGVSPYFGAQLLWHPFAR